MMQKITSKEEIDEKGGGEKSDVATRRLIQATSDEGKKDAAAR